MAGELEVRSGLTPDLVRALLARDLDIVVTSSPAADPAGLDSVRIATEPFVAVLPRSAPAAATWARIEAATRGLAFVRYTARSAIAGAVERILRQRGLEPPDRFEFDTSLSLLTTVAAGLGWAITTPICIAQSRYAADDFRIVPLPGATARRQLVIVHRRGEFEASVECIRALVTEHLSERIRSAFGATMPWIANAVSFDDAPAA